MRRAVVLLSMLVVAPLLTATTCQSPNPPPRYQRPVITSASLAPEQVEPGGHLTVSVAATDDRSIFTVEGSRMRAPSGHHLPESSIDCTGASYDPPVLSTEATLECDLPTFLSSGTWQLEVTVIDEVDPDYTIPGASRFLPFEVVGGSDDHSPPVVLDHWTTPDVVLHGTEFTFTVRATDDTPPVDGGTFELRKIESPGTGIGCHRPVVDEVTPGVYDLVHECHAFGTGGTGWHRGVVAVFDALGQTRNLEVLLEVQ